jgi:hypothetical protein
LPPKYSGSVKNSSRTVIFTLSESVYWGNSPLGMRGIAARLEGHSFLEEPKRGEGVSSFLI